MKKFLSVMLVAVLVISCLTTAFAADFSANVLVGKQTAKAGEEVTLNVTVSGEFANFEMYINAAEGLTITKIAGGNVVANVKTGFVTYAGAVNVNKVSFNVTLKVAENAKPGFYPVVASLGDGFVHGVDAEMNIVDVAVSFTNGGVTVVGSDVPPTNPDPKPSEPKPTEPKPTEPKPTEPKPTEPKPTEPKPTEPKPTEPKPTEPKPTEPKPTEPKPTEPKPTEPKPTEPKPTEPKPTEPKPTEPKPTEPKPTEPKPTEPGVDPSQPTEHVHVWDTKWSVDENNHWHVCLICGEICEHLGAHDGTWQTVKEATKTEKGLKVLVCKVCEYEMDRQEIDMLPDEPAIDPDEPTPGKYDFAMINGALTGIAVLSAAAFIALKRKTAK